MFLPQVLQKNIGLFSFLSQLAHLGNSSHVDSTRNRSKWSEGGSEWPSRRGVNFLQIQLPLLRKCVNKSLFSAYNTSTCTVLSLALAMLPSKSRISKKAVFYLPHWAQNTRVHTSKPLFESRHLCINAAGPMCNTTVIELAICARLGSLALKKHPFSKVPTYMYMKCRNDVTVRPIASLSIF